MNSIYSNSTNIAQNVPLHFQHTVDRQRRRKESNDFLMVDKEIESSIVFNRSSSSGMVDGRGLQ